MPFDHERLAPGDETYLYPEDIEEGDVVARDDVLRANQHRYELYSALMESGEAVLAPRRAVAHPIHGGSVPDMSYLRRLAGETSVLPKAGAGGYDDEWKRRRDAAAHHPLSAEILHTYVDTVARQQIDRSTATAVLGERVMMDVDMRGTPAHQWVMDAYTKGLAQGWGVALVDTPPTAADMPSRWHEQEAGIRPWVTWYSPLRVWRLVRGRHGEVADILIRESADRWRRWLPDRWELYGHDSEMIDSAPHEYGRVPAELFIADDPEGDDELDPPGLSAIRSVALVELQILHHASLLDSLETKTGYSFYHLQADNDEGAMVGLALGAGDIFVHEAVGEWKAPPVELADGLMRYLDWLEGRAYKMAGVHRRSQDSVEAHSGLALDWENAPIYATVLRWAQRLQSFEQRVWQLMAMAMRPRGARGDIAIVYPDDLSTRPVAQDLGYAEQLGRVYAGAMPPWVALARDALVRRALARLVGHMPDVARAMPADLSQSAEMLSQSETHDTDETDAGDPDT